MASVKESFLKRTLLDSLESWLYSEENEEYLNIFPLKGETTLSQTTYHAYFRPTLTLYPVLFFVTEVFPWCYFL